MGLSSFTDSFQISLDLIKTMIYDIIVIQFPVLFIILGAAFAIKITWMLFKVIIDNDYDKSRVETQYYYAEEIEDLIADGVMEWEAAIDYMMDNDESDDDDVTDEVIAEDDNYFEDDNDDDEFDF